MKRPKRWTIQVTYGATLKRFDLSEPSGAIRLLRVTVPHGTRARLTGVIPHVARITISTPQTCQRHGALDVCIQPEDACPMPPAVWHFQLHKLAGPEGEIRLAFLVG